MSGIALTSQIIQPTGNNVTGCIHLIHKIYNYSTYYYKQVENLHGAKSVTQESACYITLNY